MRTLISARNFEEAHDQLFHDIAHKNIVTFQNGKIEFIEPVQFQFDYPEECLVFNHRQLINPFATFFGILRMFKGLKVDNQKYAFDLNQLFNIVESLKRSQADQTIPILIHNVEANAFSKIKINFSITHEKFLHLEAEFPSIEFGEDLQYHIVMLSFLHRLIHLWIGKTKGSLCLGNHTIIIHHLYMFETVWRILKQPYTPSYRRYALNIISLSKFNLETWLTDLNNFASLGPAMGYTEPFFRKVCSSLFIAYEGYNSLGPPGKFVSPLHCLESCSSDDWKLACTQWLTRQYSNYKEKNPEQSTFL